MQRVPFERARNKLFEVIGSATPAPRVTELLGYAPVLVTLAARLYEERNYHAFEASLAQLRFTGAWNVLAELAESLLIREQRDKFLKNCRQTLS